MSGRQLNSARRIAALIFISCSSFAAVIVASSICLGQAPQPPQSPDVSIQVIPVKSSLERGESSLLNIIIINKSNVTLSNVKLLVTPDNMVAQYSSSVPDLTPFGSAHMVLIVRPGDEVAFSLNTLIVEVEYTWVADGKEFRSSAVASAGITVKRKFEDELGGLLPGGAAALYFLLPILPAIMAYQFIDQKRKGEPVTFTSFNIANFVPGLAGSVLANVIVYIIIGARDLLNPYTFFWVFGVSLAVGAVIPSIRWLAEICRWRRWGFREGDQDYSYLRKVLVGPYAKEYYDRVLLKAGTGDAAKAASSNSTVDMWEGILLHEKKNTYFLGSLLYVMVQNGVEETSITKDVINRDHRVFDSKKINRAVEDKKLYIQVERLVTHNGKSEPDPYVSIVPGIYTMEVQEQVRIVSLK